MFKFYRDVVILFAIFFAYLMMAGGTTPIEGVVDRINNMFTKLNRKSPCKM